MCLKWNTTLAFFFLNWKKKKGYMELNKLGRNVSIKQTSTICVTVLSEWSKAGITGLSSTVISCFRYLEWHYIASWWLGIVSGYKFYFEFTVNDNEHRFSILLCTPSVPKSSIALKLALWGRKLDSSITSLWVCTNPRGGFLSREKYSILNRKLTSWKHFTVVTGVLIQE